MARITVEDCMQYIPNRLEFMAHLRNISSDAAV